MTGDKLQQYSRERLKGHNMLDSALAAGYSESTARKAGERLEGRHEQLIKEALPAVGATNIFAAQRVMAALNAKRVIYCDGDMQETEIDDHKIQLDAVKLVAQLTGQLESKTQIAVQVVLPAVAAKPDAWGDE